ncbi:hypothetical protein A6D6_02292 [Alcanivorax xiamenensis]|uniref:Zn-dependent hydrolase n=1 Tax=Alcanivorax xiamenensis TaxID=1177156 RepID=A0ABQ6Y7Z6_9GAMM|nr:M90 family metallopeptidase [Alcanivorax xiamenensis]KAF0805486.1 hypothetical protein A6D6_02292 [Alcanivorax xiamenensis]
MFDRTRLWLENRRLARLPVTREQWEHAIADWAPARRYQGERRERLFQQTLRFLLRKEFRGGGDFQVTPAMQLKIATMAVVMIMGLDLDWYDGWYTVIVYEDAFVTPGDEMDEFGIVHSEGRVLAGEAWDRGPVLLSWQDVQAAASEPGFNVVLHEMAHKLDMRNGAANGAPPLHHGMDARVWHDTFTRAWSALENAEREGEPFLDPYALQDPGEFFAVITESFFETPEPLEQILPEVYGQLTLFYRQDPLRGR